MDRAEIVHENFLTRVQAHDLPQGAAPAGGLAPDTARRIFQAQLNCRALDRTSRKMQKEGQGFYTIGSSGHEGMAALAWALRVDDMAFLHYRDGAFQLARADQAGQTGMVRDMLLSFACSAEDPISGGRHKVLGSKSLFIPPQTSTIASHLPKAVGAAYSIALAKRIPPAHRQLAQDGIVMCSFGDASFNHSTAQGALNAAGWTSVQGAALPLLFVCEDNGIGISTKTPKGWIANSMQNRPGVAYFHADGLDIYDTYKTATQAAAYVRTKRKPAFLHLRMVRLYGHAGADVPTSYLSRSEVEQDEANDPLLHSVRLLHQSGAMPPDEALELYRNTEQQLETLRARVVTRPHLETAQEVMASLIPPPRTTPCVTVNHKTRAQMLGNELKAQQSPQPMGKLINWAISDLMLSHPELILMGEDIGRKGGVYGVTQKLQNRFGATRVIDSLLDEQSILGLAIGLAHNGFIPMPEIQFLAYLHNAEDQLRGEAATLPFFSNGQFSNPMVLRIAGLGYQKGFGGHFHNDNSLAVLRDIPGLIIACPSNGADAAMMLRESVRLAAQEQRVVVFIEPIALYHTRDLMAGDQAWITPYPAPEKRIPLHEIGQHGTGRDLAIVSYGNGYHLSRQAALTLENQGLKTRVIDLRWLAPLPEKALLAALKDCAHVLIVDECRATGGQGEALIALFAKHELPSFTCLASKDSFIATGPAHAATMPSVENIIENALRLYQNEPHRKAQRPTPLSSFCQ